MIVPCSIEPRVVVEPGHVNDQRIALPVAIRPPHPGIGGRLPMRIHVDGAGSSLVLIDDQYFAGSLENLKWKRHVVGARHARPITLEFRLATVIALRIVGDLHGHPLFKVLLLFRQRFRAVRNYTAFDNTLPSGSCAPCAQKFGMRSRLSPMRLKVPICRSERLPNPVQVGFAVRRAGRRVSREPGGRSLTRGRSCGQPQRGHGNGRHGYHHASHSNIHQYLCFE